MKSLFLTILLFVSANAFAAPADPVVTYTDSYNGYATIVGRLMIPPTTAVGITVENGGIRYSTVTDATGNWALTIRLRAYNADISSWDLVNSADPSDSKKLSISIR